MYGSKTRLGEELVTDQQFAKLHADIFGVHHDPDHSYGPTKECPPITQFEHGVAVGWESDQAIRAHVTSCSFCQSITASIWRKTCPSPELVARYKRDPAGFPDRSAMEKHLGVDACETCRRVYPSPGKRPYAAVAALSAAAAITVAVVGITVSRSSQSPPSTRNRSVTASIRSLDARSNQGIRLDLGACPATSPAAVHSIDGGGQEVDLEVQLPLASTPAGYDAHLTAASDGKLLKSWTAISASLDVPLNLVLDRQKLTVGQRYKLTIFVSGSGNAYCSIEFSIK